MIQRVLRNGENATYEGDARRIGTKQDVNFETLCVKKPNGFMANSRGVGQALGKRCEGLRRRAG